jgi:two-component system response regulator YesN
MGAGLWPVKLDWDQLGYYCVLRLESDRLLLLYPESAENHSMPRGAIQLCEQVEHLLEKDSEHYDWFISEGEPACNLMELKQALHCYDRQIDDRFYNESRARIVERSAQLLTKPASSLPYESRSDLLRSISHGNTHGFQFHATELGMKLAESRRPVSEVKAFVAELLTMTLSYAKERGYSQLDEFELICKPAVHVDQCTSIQEIHNLLFRVYGELGLRTIRADSGGSPARTASPFIRKAIQYMRENYHRNISTADIAEHVKLSRSYLSDLYGKETGESLSETLLLIRIEEAKRKLRSGEMKVYEIAEAVGFPDSKTFAKAFKRMEGCSPKEYDSSNK